MNYELQVLLGLNCNFKCSHCLNSSYPGNRCWDITDSEVNLLSETIINNQSINLVSFSGGEPLLYINQIEKLVSKVRSKKNTIKFSITTNGSLIKSNEKLINKINFDYAMLSFDKEHSEFISNEKFQEALMLSLNLFSNFEVNITYANSLHYQPIKDFLIKNKIKVNFTELIESGRSKFSEHLNIPNSLNSLTCPNLESKNTSKITYIPSKGFTVCCGPVVFDQIINEDISFFKSLDLLKQNLLYNFLIKTEKVQIYSKGQGCNRCRNTLKNVTNKDLKSFLENSSWDNILFNWDYEILEHHNKLFNPKIVKKADKGCFYNYLANSNLIPSENIIKIEGDNLPYSEIEAFSHFTIETFYDVHTSYYSRSDITKFISDQKIFFNLPNKYIRHYIDDKIVGYIAVCQIDTHPYFNEKSWHIGYWGMSQSLDKSERETIKKDWANLLANLNGDALIAVNIDYFNLPANRLSEKFNFKSICVRLDPRQ